MPRWSVPTRRTAPNAAAGDSTRISVAPFVDPGEENRQAARDKLNRARTQLIEVGDRAAGTIRPEGDKAPETSMWDDIGDFFGDVGEVIGDFAAGVWDGFTGSLEFAWDLVTNPAATVAALAQGIGNVVQDPVGFAKQTWNEFTDNPARFLGNLAGGALAGGGALKAAKVLRGAGKKHGRDHDTSDEIETPRGEPSSPDKLTSEQASNLARYEKKLPSKHEQVQLEQLPDGGVRMSAKVPSGNIPGSYAEYIKVVDGNGGTSSMSRTHMGRMAT